MRAETINDRAARRLREIRQDANLTQADLARLLGIQPSSAAAVDRGERPLRLDEIVRLADELGVSPLAFLLADVPDPLDREGLSSGSHTEISGRTVDADDFNDWVRGRQLLPKHDDDPQTTEARFARFGGGDEFARRRDPVVRRLREATQAATVGKSLALLAASRLATSPELRDAAQAGLEHARDLLVEALTRLNLDLEDLDEMERPR